MKRCTVVLGMLGVVWLAHAQVQPERLAPAPQSVGSVDLAKPTRQEIAAQRAQFSTQFDALEAQCQMRFAVNACLQDVQAQRRAAMARLRAQEAALNTQDRIQRGAEQAARSQAKAQERAALDQEIAEKHVANLQEQAQKQTAQSRKNQEHRDLLMQPPGSQPRVPKLPAGPDPAEQLANRADFERRQAQAMQHAKDLEARQAERAKKPASKLPVPP